MKMLRRLQMDESGRQLALLVLMDAWTHPALGGQTIVGPNLLELLLVNGELHARVARRPHAMLTWTLSDALGR